MAEKYKLLLLDDEAEILNSLKRLFRKEFDIHAFDDPNEALAALNDNNFALIISDMRMPIMDGASFLAQAKEIAPQSVRILLTGYSDMDSTSRAINEGNIFSYVSKPWNNSDLKQLLANAIEHYQIKQENRSLNQKLKRTNQALNNVNEKLEELVKKRTAALKNSNEKLVTSVDKQRSLFQQMIQLVSLIIEDRTKDSQGHNKRVALHCKLLAEQLKLSRPQVINIYIAALVHDLGKISLDDELLSIAEHQLDPQQYNAFAHHAEKGAELLNTLPQMDAIANVIKHQYEHVDGTGLPDHQSRENIPLASKLLRLVVDYDRLLLGLKTGAHLSPDEAFRYIQSHSGKIYDQTLVQEYKKLLANIPAQSENDIDYCVACEELEEGMYVAKDVLNKSGGVMVTKGTLLSKVAIKKLIEYETQTNFRLTIYVY